MTPGKQAVPGLSLEMPFVNGAPNRLGASQTHDPLCGFWGEDTQDNSSPHGILLGEGGK